LDPQHAPQHPPTVPCPCPSLSPSPSPPAAARAAAAASVEEHRDSPEAAARSPRTFPTWIRSRRRSPASDDGRPAASGRAAVQLHQAASPAASSGEHARCLPLPDPVRSRGDRASLPRRERRRATDARRRTLAPWKFLAACRRGFELWRVFGLRKFQGSARGVYMASISTGGWH